jgi:divalent metal cation (Fe/Co/Zn/Cd) transporter
MLINADALFSLIFALLTGISIDGYIGALLALVFLRSGYSVAREALGRIIGNPSDGSVARKIKEIVKNHEGVLGTHDLVVHNYGHKRDMASIHVEVPTNMTLADSYDMVEKISHAISEQLGIPIAIQLTPIDLADERLQSVISITQNFIAECHANLHPHEFRIVESMPKPIIVFDLEFPLDVKRVNALILRDSISKEITQLLPEYDCDINIEYSYAE